MALSFYPSPSCKCLFPLLGTCLTLELTCVSLSSSLRWRRGWTRSRVNFSEGRPQNDTWELPKTWLDLSYVQKEHVLLFCGRPPRLPPVVHAPPATFSACFPALALSLWRTLQTAPAMNPAACLPVPLPLPHWPKLVPRASEPPENHREPCSLLWKP